MIRHVAAGGLRRGGAQLGRHLELLRVDRRVGLEVGELHLLHHAPVQLVLAVHRHFDAIEVAPVGEDLVVRDVAPDVVVVERADADRQAGFGVERDREGAVADGGIRHVGDFHVEGGTHLRGIGPHRQQEAAYRAAQSFALGGGEPQA